MFQPFNLFILKQTIFFYMKFKGGERKILRKPIQKDKDADVQMIGAVVGILVTLIIAVLVFYNVAASIDTSSIDTDLTGTPSANATDDTMDQAATFFTIAPIIAIVIVAVIILRYVGKI